MPPSDAARPGEAIALLALAALASGISFRCVEPMLPRLAAEFGTSVSAISVVVTTFAFAYAGAVLIMGPLGDRFGKLRVVTIAAALTGLASFGCAAAWDVGSLAALRLVMGIFASSSVALGMAYLGDVVPVAQRQATMANFIAGSLVGQMLGPLYGGMFTDWAGWRASFLVLAVVFLLVATVLFWRTARSWPAIAPGRFEPFAVYRRLIARVPVRWLAAIGVAETFFFFGPYVFLGAYLKLRFDLSFTLIGLILAGFGFGGLLFSVAVRPLIRLLGERGLPAAGGALGGAMFVAILFVPHWTLTIPCVIGLGSAFYMIHNPMQTRATEVAPDARGSCVALYACAWGGGQALGVAAMGIAVSLAGYAPMIAAFGIGYALLGYWLRTNIARLKP